MSRSRTLLVAVEVVVEGATGLALIAVPAVVARVLFGTDLPEIGATMARIAGIVLVALVLGCWLGRQARAAVPALAALLAYNALVAVYLAWLGIEGVFLGLLLWPAVAVHAVVTAMLVLALLEKSGRPTPGQNR